MGCDQPSTRTPPMSIPSSRALVATTARTARSASSERAECHTHPSCREDGVAGLARNSAAFITRYAHWTQGSEWSTGLGPLVLEKTRWAASLVLQQLFSPVLSVAGAVCAVGLILFALSFMTRPEH